MKLISTLVAAFAAILLPAVVQAAQLTYDIRVDAATSSPGVTIVDAHNAVASNPGDVVGVMLYAVIANNNGNNADDGFTLTNGSFLADSATGGGGLVGNLRGDANYATDLPTQQNNVPGANAAISQSGFAFDLNGDGGLDVGDVTNNGGSPAKSPWFIAIGGTGAGGTTLGSGMTSGATEILIGRTTYTVGAGAVSGQSTQINYVPRLFTTGGTIATRKINKFVMDGAVFSLSSDDPNVATVGAHVLFTAALPPPPVATLTYDIRVDAATSSPGVTVVDAHHAVTSNPGDVVGVMLYAVMANNNGNNADDGFTLTHGSFVADSVTGEGGLVGNLRGDTNFVVNGQTQQNNVPGADAAISQSGFVFDLNGDGGLDVGDIANHGGAPNPAPWFVAVGGTGVGGTTFGTGATTNPTEILIGKTTYTVGAGAQAGQSTQINYVPRLFTTGGVVSTHKVNMFVVDGVTRALTSDDPNILTIGAHVSFTPAPPLPPLPGAVTRAPMSVAATNAVLAAVVSPNGSPTTAKFQWGLTTAYGTEIPVTVSSPTSEPQIGVNAKLTGLSPGTTYHYRISATNAGGTTNGDDVTFTTPAAQPPEVLLRVDEFPVSPTSVTFSGVVTPRGSPTTAMFEYGTTTAYDTQVAVTPDPGDGSASVSVKVTVTGLTPNTGYHFRLSATNQAGTAASDDWVFSTGSLRPPVAITYPATTIGASSATLNAFVGFPIGQGGPAKFQYGPSTDYGSEAAATAATTTTDWSNAALTGLTPGMTYHYRITATNATGTTNGADMTFTTLAVDAPQPPYAGATTVSNFPDSATKVTAQFIAFISANGLATTAKFEMGTTTNYGTDVPVVFMPNNETILRKVVSGVVTLQPNTTYHCRLSATNAAGTTHGDDTTFTTDPLLTAPVVGDLVPAGLNYSSATFTSTINPGGSNTTAYLQYGLTTSYGKSWGIPEPFSDHAAHPVTVTIGGLTSNTTYHCRIVASNQTGQTIGPDVTFTTPVLPPGPWLTYEMRVDPVSSSPNVVVSADRKSAQCSAPGDVVALQLFAIVKNNDGNNANDGFTLTNGSFVATSGGGLIGNLRGDTNFVLNGQTQQNNVPGANAAISQSGFAFDLNGDGGLDVGDVTNHGGAPTPAPWFMAVGGTQGGGTTFGTGASAAPTEFLIGQTTYTLAANSQAGQASTINYVPRLFTTGGVASERNTNKFVLDGFATALRSDDPNVVVAAPVAVSLVAPAVPPVQPAAALTYDIRVDPATSSPGVTIVDAHNAKASGAGDVVGVQLYAVIANADGNNANDGFGVTDGSFLADSISNGGGLVGDLRGDTNSIRTQQNNVPGANAAISQSGFAFDLNGDGGLDIGSLIKGSNIGKPEPWFIAVGGSGAGGVTYGTGTTSAPTEVLIGRTTFTIKPGAQAGQSTQIDYVPLLSANANGNGTAGNMCVADGVFQALKSEDPKLATIGANVAIGSTPTPHAPVAITGVATNVTSTTATLSGSVNPMFGVTTALIQYGTSTAYGVNTPVQLQPSNGGSAQNVSINLTGLNPNTTYHFRVSATNGLGTNNGADVTFATTAQPAPTVATDSNFNAWATRANIRGTVNPNGGVTTAKMQYGLTTDYGTDVPVKLSPNNGFTALAVIAIIEGLTPNTTYHFRVSATNGGGTAVGDDLSFKTPAAVPPAALNLVPGKIGTTTATFTGNVTPAGSPTTAILQIGKTTAYGTDIPVTLTLPDSPFMVPISVSVAGLTPNTVYHARLSATNPAGTATSMDLVIFTHPLSLPIAYTYTATTIGATGATLNGLYSSPDDEPATAVFQYGLTTDYGSEAVAAAPSNYYTNAALTGLAPGTTYHYRLSVTNVAGTKNGDDMTFTTLATPAQQPPFVGPVSAQLGSSAKAVSVALTALMSPNGVATWAKFQIGTTVSYGLDLPVAPSPADGTTLQQIKGSPSLQPNTTYHCRLVAWNAAGTTSGPDSTFTTPSILTAPIVGPVVFAAGTTTSATLTSTINPGGMNTTATLEFGTTTSYGGSRSIVIENDFDSNTHPVSVTLTNLTPNTTYHCRITAINSIGTTQSPDVSFLTTPGAAGPALTYEMRVDPTATSPGVVVSADRKSAQCGAPGDVVALQLYAIFHNNDGDNTNDGFRSTQGSFVATSGGGLVGNLRGDTNFVVNGQTQQNNVAGANAAISQSGFVFDLDGDGGLDVGDITNHGADTNPSKWFLAIGGTGAGGTTFGTGAGSGPTEILIGQTTYTLAAGAQPGQASTINYVPRLFTTGGTVATRNTNKFVLDGVTSTLRSDDPNVTVAAPVAVSLAAPAAPIIPAALLTYDIRVDPATSSPGVNIADAHNATVSGAGDIVGVGLYAIVNGLDGTHTNDGFSHCSGSFLSTGALLGVLRGDAPGHASSQMNNVVPFDLGFSTSGFQADLDGDGDLDVGPDFRAYSQSSKGQFGSGDGTGPTEFLIGRTTYTVGAGAQAGQQTTVHFVPVLAADDKRFTIDGKNINLGGADPALATIGANIQVGGAIVPQTPAAITGVATNVTSTSVTLNGTVNPNLGITTALFQSGPTTAYGRNTPLQLLPNNGGTLQTLSATVTGLTPETTYHFRITATNAQGTNNGTDVTFTTTAQPPPTLVDVRRADFQATYVTISTEINPNGGPTTAKIQFGLTTDYGTDVPIPLSPNDSFTSQRLIVKLAGLTPNTTYHYRASATNSGGTVNGADLTFTTRAAALPSVLFSPVTSVGTTTVTFKGTVTPHGSPTTAVFQSGLTTDYGTDTVVVPAPGDGPSAVNVSATLTGLLPDQTYHARLSAANLAGPATTTDVVFHTQPLSLPVADTYPATTIGAAGATLNAVVTSPADEPVAAKFQYGLTANYDSEIAAAATSNGWVAAGLSGLVPNTTYHYRISATNVAGTKNGDDLTFTTRADSTPQPPYVGAVSAQVGASTKGATAALSALVSPNGSATTAAFQLGTTTNYGSFFPVTLSPPDGTGLQQMKGSPAAQPNTTYHCRLIATNSVGTSFGPDSIFTTPPIPSTAPIVGVVGSSSVTTTSAVINSTINPGGLATTATLEFGTTKDYGENRSIDLPSNADNTAHAVSVALFNLVPNTTYHCRVTAGNSAGATRSADASFTTIATPAGAALTYEMRIDPAGTSPGVIVSPDLKSAQCGAPGDVVALQLYAIFQNNDGKRTNDGFTSTQGSFVATSGGGMIGNLRGDTNYVPNGQTKQNNVPGADAAISQSGFVFDLNGDGGLDVGDITNHGPDTNPSRWFAAIGGTGAGGTTFGTGTGAGPTEILIGQTTYTVAVNGRPGKVSTINYVPRLFTTGGVVATHNTNKFVLDGVTLALRSDDPNVVVAAPVTVSSKQPPLVVSGNATGVTATSATLNGTVNPYGIATTAHFQSGLTDAYGTDTAVTLAPSDGNAPQSVSATLTSLLPNTTYHFRLSATSIGGSTDGNDMTFTTLADTVPPTIAPPAGGFQPLTLTTGVDGTAALPDYTGQAVTDDNVGVTAVTQVPVPGAVNVGVVHVILTAHDAAGNTADAGFDVTVLDGTAPVITRAPDPVSAGADASGHAAVPDVTGSVTATDNVAVTSITQAPPAGASAGVGDTNIVVTVADAAGNTATAGVTLTVLPFIEPDRGRGYYSGLLDDGVGSADGVVTLLVNAGGAFSGKVSLQSVTKGFQGVFHNDTAQVGIPGLGSLMLTRAAVTGIDLSLGGFSGHADNSPYSTASPAPMRGSYTVLLPPDPAHAGNAAFPQGTGFATLKVNPLGVVRCVGRVGDSAPFAFDSSVHGDGAFPCYDALYTSQQGSIGGTLTFRDLEGSDLDGTLAWSKPAQTGASGHFRIGLSDGFDDLSVPAIGSFYQPASTPLQMLAYNNTHRATVSFHDGGLSAPMSGTATVRAVPSAFVTPPMQDLAFSPGDGTFTGTLRPSSARGGPRPFLGVVFQKQNRGAGIFIGANVVGGVDYVPQP